MVKISHLDTYHENKLQKLYSTHGHPLLANESRFSLNR